MTGVQTCALPIYAFSMLADEFPEYKLVIYGQGVLEDELRAQIKSLNLEDRVLLPGFASNILEKVAPCSMFVSSSDFEGISNSMLEALGMGLPAVVTDCPVGGARMIIKSGENGILVPVGDTQAMYEAMRSILKDPARSEEHTSELQSLVVISYAVFCLKKKLAKSRGI